MSAKAREQLVKKFAAAWRQFRQPHRDERRKAWKHGTHCRWAARRVSEIRRVAKLSRRLGELTTTEKATVQRELVEQR